MPILRQALAGLQQGLAPTASDYEFGEQYDNRVREDRAAEDQNLQEMQQQPGFGGPGYPNQGAMQFNRMREDMANGPQGYNRPWTTFFERLRGQRVKGLGAGLPKSPAPAIQGLTKVL